MTAIVTGAEMAKAKRRDVVVKIDAEVARMAKVLAAAEDKSLAEYISETLRPIVTRESKKLGKRLSGPSEGGEG